MPTNEKTLPDEHGGQLGHRMSMLTTPTYANTNYANTTYANTNYANTTYANTT